MTEVRSNPSGLANLQRELHTAKHNDDVKIMGHTLISGSITMDEARTALFHAIDSGVTRQDFAAAAKQAGASDHTVGMLMATLDFAFQGTQSQQKDAARDLGYIR